MPYKFVCIHQCFGKVALKHWYQLYICMTLQTGRLILTKNVNSRQLRTIDLTHLTILIWLCFNYFYDLILGTSLKLVNNSNSTPTLHTTLHTILYTFDPTLML
jgi:hypothetical protein